MDKLMYVCRSCGELKPITAYKTWQFGFKDNINYAHAANCNDCRARKEKEKTENGKTRSTES